MTPLLGDKLLGDIRPADVRSVVDGARAAGKKRGTIVHIRATLRRILEQARIEQLIVENPVGLAPMPKIREVKRRRAILTDAEILKFIDCPDIALELRLLALAARVEGGMRTRDLTAWAWEMIDQKLFASCIVPRTKTEEPQRLEIPEILQVPLRAWWVAAGEPCKGPIFPVTKGKRKGEARKARGVSFAARLRRELLVVGIDRHELHHETAWSRPADFHSFRRAFKTRLAETGISTEHAMHISGSSDPRTHARYVMATEAMQKIPAAALPRRAPTFATTSATKGAESSVLSERDTRFELATLSLGSCLIPENSREVQRKAAELGGQDPQGFTRCRGVLPRIATATPTDPPWPPDHVGASRALMLGAHVCSLAGTWAGFDAFTLAGLEDGETDAVHDRLLAEGDEEHGRGPGR